MFDGVTDLIILSDSLTTVWIASGECFVSRLTVLKVRICPPGLWPFPRLEQPP
jgi:hypothetical protein